MRELQSLYTSIVLVMIFLLSACVPDIKVVDESENWNPYFSVPLLVANVSMEDLLESVETDEILQLTSDSLLIVAYKESISVTASPNIQPIPDFPVPITAYNQTLPNPTSGDFRLDIIDVKEGTLSYAMANPYTEAVNVSIKLTDIRQSGQILEWEFTIPAAPSASNPTMQEGEMDLTGYEIDFRNGFTTEYTATLANSGSVVGLHPFALGMANLDFSYVQGYFGQFDIEIPSDSLYFGFLDNWEQGILEFVDPSLRFDFHSTYGLPVAITTETLAFHTFTKGVQPIQNASLTNGLMINYPNINQVGNPRTTTLILDKSNSNIVGVTSGIPFQMDYALKAQANPNNNMAITNHLTDSVQLAIDVEASIPLYGSARGFTFENEFDIDTDGLEDVEKAGMKIVAENGFPIDVAVQIYFLDESDNVLDSLFEDKKRLMDAAQVNGSGSVTNSTITENLVEIEEDRFELIKNEATQIRLATSIETPDGGETPVRIYNYYDLIVKIGLLAGF